MPRVSLSYRRTDSADITGRIFDRLAARYGKPAVFRDIDNIPVGADFRSHIAQELKKSDVLLAIIGPDWLGSSNEQTCIRRIDEPHDLVRIEIETALHSSITIIPVLVRSGQMPTSSQLPVGLQPLSHRHAIQIDSGQDFDAHTDRLIRRIDSLTSSKRIFSNWRVRLLTFAAVVAAIAALSLGYWKYAQSSSVKTDIPWLANAYTQIGMQEFDGPSSNPRIIEYLSTVIPITPEVKEDAPNVDWATGFVAWSLGKANISGPIGMDPLNWLNWGRALHTPVEGCVVVLTFAHGGSHVGFYIDESDGLIRTLGGNQDNTVSIKRYLKTRVRAYRWPSDRPAPP